MYDFNLYRVRLKAVSIISVIATEIQLAWAFIWRDASTTIMPALLFTFAAIRTLPQPSVEQISLIIFRNLTYFFLYVFVFCLSNQLTGLEEDRVNKPDRPLVRGACTPQGAMLRWVGGMFLFTLVGWGFGVLEWAVLWQIIVVLHNFAAWAKNWVFKNFAMGAGTVTLFAAAWQLATPLTSRAWDWILLTAATMPLALVSIQDLRDMAGDRVAGRRTFPLVFGETITRAKLSLCFGVLPFVTHWLVMLPANYSWNSLICEGLLAGLSWVIAYRVWFLRSPQADHRSYMLYTYWFCLVVASAIIVA